MPKLLLFAPCERALITQDNLVSLISVIENVTITLESASIPPEDAISAYPWQVIILWRRTPDDEGKRYEQLFEIVLSEGRVAAETKVALDMSLEGTTNKALVNVPGFAVGQPGEHVLRLSLRSLIEPDVWSDWIPVSEYTMRTS